MNRQERRLKTRSAPRGEQAVSVEHSNLWVGQCGSGSRRRGAYSGAGGVPAQARSRDGRGRHRPQDASVWWPRDLLIHGSARDHRPVNVSLEVAP
jgi:hypothetical protein